METKPSVYQFNISYLSDYQLYWLNYELSTRCSKTELEVIRREHNLCKLIIHKSMLSLNDIQLILKENQIVFELTNERNI
ncbi:conserved hypothetical protein [Flavobacterium sp. 9AF]|uniref:hypothetical protein n=1 Tax=Flavobacterium sp. 9AF TaxID=2653142 RepID=UPI0012F0CDD9|nr:hypothetical protein [Flavobacterium sp. 9AF]VXB99454.1 conserved hypothetical protein [Flavobacterium sp. 9AF]